MKKISILMLFALAVLIALSACKPAEDDKDINNDAGIGQYSQFLGKILALNDGSIRVAPAEGEEIKKISGEIEVITPPDMMYYLLDMTETDVTAFSVGYDVKVVYDTVDATGELTSGQVRGLELYLTGVPEQNTSDIPTVEYMTFPAIVVETGEIFIDVIPDEMSDIRLSSDRVILSFNADGFFFHAADGTVISREDIVNGARITVFYAPDAEIMESYPAQMEAMGVQLIEAPVLEISPYTDVNICDNAYMSVKDFSATGATAVIYAENSDNVEYGSWFSVEKNVDGVWVGGLAGVDESEIGWTEEAYTVPNGGSSEQSIAWDWLYGTLAEGQYRLVKNVLVLNDAGEYETFYLAAEFSVE